MSNKKQRTAEIKRLMDALGAAVDESSMAFTVPVVMAVTEFIADPASTIRLARIMHVISQCSLQTHQQEAEEEQ